MSQSAEPRDSSQRGPCLVAAAHFFENLGKQNVLTRFVRLPRDGALLCSQGVVQAVLMNSYHHDPPQRFWIMYIEPAGVAERHFRANSIVLLGVQSPERESGPIVSPVFPSKVFYKA